jgi:ATP-binding cassette subfamily B protein
MWNRQREAEEAREKLARMEEGPPAPNRNPPPVDDPAIAPLAAASAVAARDVPADAAE